MLQPELSDEIERLPDQNTENRTTSLPDLFNIINKEIESEKTELKNKEEYHSSEFVYTNKDEEKIKISDSQKLEVLNSEKPIQSFNNQEDKIKKIIILYENGKFESFEP